MKVKKYLICTLLLGSMLLTACQTTSQPTSTTTAKQTEIAQTDGGTVPATNTEATASTLPEEEIQVDAATNEEVEAFLNGTDTKNILVDARPQEAYSGWALGGAENGGHLKGAILYSARWLDSKMDEERRVKRLDEYNEIIKLSPENNYIVYDYDGAKEAAVNVAKYFKKQGVINVKYFNARELINAGQDLVKYNNHDRYLPAEIVKVISDYKSGATDELNSAVTEAAGITEENIDKVVLIDVSYGNVHESSYLTDGHIPGAIHLNTNAYERPRSYTPEKREPFSIEYSLIPLEEFRDELLTEYGIDKDSIVIASSDDGRPLSRFGFMLRSLGVKYYAMSANMNAWNYNGYRLDKENVVKPVSVATFGSDSIPYPEEIVWMDQVKRILSGEEEGTIIGSPDFGTYGYHDLMGKIPGTVDEGNVISQNIDGTPPMKELILQGYEEAGISINKLIVPFCGDGWGASRTAYNAQAVDIENVKYWGEGWVVWSNRGNEFETHDGKLVHYDKYLDAVVDADGNIISDEKVMKTESEPEE